MNITIHAVLLLLAVICFVMSAIGVPSKINLESSGLALMAMALLIAGLVVR